MNEAKLAWQCLMIMMIDVDEFAFFLSAFLFGYGASFVARLAFFCSAPFSFDDSLFPSW